MNNIQLTTQLHKLGLTADEATIYLALLSKPSTHLQLSRTTGVNRTKIYRIVEDLQQKGLISKTVDDEGKVITASPPQNLQISLATEEAKLASQRQALDQTLPTLAAMFSATLIDPNELSINTYYGTEGFKQMLWNETKTKDEILVFGYSSIEELSGSHTWAEKHRQQTVDRNYNVREIINIPVEGRTQKPESFTTVPGYMSKYESKKVSTDVLDMTGQIVIYNQTVGIYSWQGDKKVGCEINSPFLAKMQRQIFEHYWEITP